MAVIPLIRRSKALLISHLNKLVYRENFIYEENIQRMEDVLNEIINKVKENVDVNDIKYEGISEFADSSIKYKLRVWCRIENKFQIKRVKMELDERNIQIPYNQLDVHTK